MMNLLLHMIKSGMHLMSQKRLVQMILKDLENCIGEKILMLGATSANNLM
jgi:hypothetical protein